MFHSIADNLIHYFTHHNQNKSLGHRTIDETESTKSQRVLWRHRYLTTTGKQDVADEINMASQVQVSSPVKCFSSQTLES